MGKKEERNYRRERPHGELSFALAKQPPIFLHQVNVGRSESRSDVDFSVGNAFVDCKFRDWPPIDEQKKYTAATFNAQSIEHNSPVPVELKQPAIGSVRARTR